ncbi:hypothetical protein [Virgibacillus ihumii]|uniref:hypothetical protein n=1 Tax=Virgibacillus ihumii TaxID=2686091 RepID=UPI001FE89FBB|nr:hypothetical protein [Virgibacillus ihumii]
MKRPVIIKKQNNITKVLTGMESKKFVFDVPVNENSSKNEAIIKNKNIFQYSIISSNNKEKARTKGILEKKINSFFLPFFRLVTVMISPSLNRAND